MVAAASAAVSQAFGRFTFSLLFTEVRDDFGLSNTAAGTLGSANLLAYLSGTLVLSVLIGRVGLSRTTRIGVAGVSVGLVVLAFSPGYLVVLVALLTTGVFAAGVWVTVPALAAASVRPERRGSAIGIVGAGIGLGIMVAATLHTGPGAGNWRAVYRVEAVLAVLVLVAAMRWLRVRSVKGPAHNGLDAMRAVPRWRRLLLTYGLYGFAMSLMVTFLVAVLMQDGGYSRSSASFAFSCFGAGTILGGPLFGPMADRWGRTVAMRLGLGCQALSALLIGWAVRPWAVLAAASFGLAFTGVPTTVAARMSDSLAAERFGSAYAVATLAFGVGLMAGPQVGGLIGDATGSFRPVFWSAAAVASLAGVLVRADPRVGPPLKP